MALKKPLLTCILAEEAKKQKLVWKDYKYIMNFSNVRLMMKHCVIYPADFDKQLHKTFDFFSSKKKKLRFTIHNEIFWNFNFLSFFLCKCHKISKSHRCTKEIDSIELKNCSLVQSICIAFIIILCTLLFTPLLKLYLWVLEF